MFLRKVFLLLLPVSAFAQWLNYPAPGVPRTADGKPNLNAPTPRTASGKPDLSGVWEGPGGGSYDRTITRDLKPSDIQPWAEAVYRERVLNMGKDAPRAACLPDPFVYYHVVDVARMVQTPGLILVLYQGTTNSVHRTIFTDGRKLPVDPNPSWLGYSIGHWDGDVMVVESSGFTERSWLDIEGHPHSNALKITERYRRPNFGHLEVEITIDDSKAFTRPFSFKIQKKLTPDTDLLESICEGDSSPPHMVGAQGSALNATELANYVGTYEYAGGIPAVISIEGELLFLQEGANPLKLPVAANSATSFVSRTDGSLINFALDTQGKPVSFVFHTAGGDKRAVRK